MRHRFTLALLPLALAGLISGSAIAGSQHKFKVFILGLNAGVANQAYAMGLLPYSFPPGEIGQPYSATLASLLEISPIPAASGYRDQVVWSTTGELPAGLSLTGGASAPAITGTPTDATPGAEFELIATYSGSNGRRVYTIVVGGATLDVTNIAAGTDFTCAVTTAGGAKCWGSGGNGQLGDGNSTSSIVPVDVAGLTSGVASIATSTYHTCAVTTTGGAKCWGLGINGQLGGGTTSASPVPVDVAGLTSGVASISVSGSHTCAVTSSGGAKCWGSNLWGKLGDGTTTASSIPVNVAGLTSGVASIAVGAGHSCAVTSSGGAKCWGNGSDGRLGNSGTTNSYVPVDVTGLNSGVARIALGPSYTCAVTSSGGAKCWGSNLWGKLGDGTTTASSIPVNVAGLTSGVANLKAGASHACAVTTSGGAKCWGKGTSGQLGNGDTTTSYTPVDVAGLSSGVASLTAGGDHSCAVTNSGVTKCWGVGTLGQLGNGGTASSSTPVDTLAY